MRLVPVAILAGVSFVAYSRPMLTGKLIVWTLVGIVLAMILAMLSGVKGGRE